MFEAQKQFPKCLMLSMFAHLVVLGRSFEESSSLMTIEVLSINKKQGGFCSNYWALTQFHLWPKERLQGSAMSIHAVPSAASSDVWTKS